MSKIFRILAVVLGVFVVLIVGLYIYLRSADLTVYEEQIEAYASRAIGHELDIGGRFELQFGGRTRLFAEDVSLQNPEWPVNSSLLRVGSVAVVVDTWSVFGGPFVVEELQARDIEGRVELLADRSSNWDTEGVAEEDHGDFDTERIAFRQVTVDGINVSYVDHARPRPIDVEIESLTIAPDATDILDLDLRGTINELPLWADGRLGPWQNFLDGKDISADLDLTLGTVRLSVNGSADDLPYLEGITLDASLAGPDAGRVIERLALPPFTHGPFEIDARITKMEGGHQVRAEGNLGAIDVFVSGTIDRFIRTERAELDFSIAGPDTKYVAELFGVTGVPAEPFRVAGDLKLAGDTATFSDTQMSVGPNSIALDGQLEAGEEIPDGRLTFIAEGPDFAVLGPFINVDGLPREAFDARGELEKQGSAWQVRGLEARVGENRVNADGSITVGRREDNEIVFRAEGPDISILQDFTELEGLPARPFDVTARIRSHPQGIAIEEAVGVFGDNRLQVDGVVSSTMVGTALRVNAQGPELRNVAILTGVPFLPDGPFDILGNLRLERDVLHFESPSMIVGDLSGSASGQAGFGERAGYLDVTAAIEGQHARQFAAIGWLQPLASAPFSVRGRLETAREVIELTDVVVTAGDYRASADGTLSMRPRSNDSDLAFSLAGPSLKAVGRMAGTDLLADKAFDVSGQFTGTPKGFAVQDFLVRIGQEDLQGRFTVDLSGKPRLTGQLTSAFLDLRERLRPVVEGGEEDDEPETDADGLLFSEEPIDTGLLQAADVDMELRVDRFRANTIDVTDFQVGVRLLDGALTVDPIRMKEGEGNVDGSVSLSRVANGHALEIELAANELHLGLAATEGQDRSTLPSLSGTIRFRGTGVSVHDIMASAQGEVSMRQGAGEVKEFVAAAIFSDVVLEALRTINPMRQKDEMRRLDCGIYEISIADGIATLEQAAMQTDRLLLVATGNVDLGTEKLNVNFRAKPREGLGVSLGTLANSFLGVRGSLAAPKITIDPKSSAAATGAAVATGGISLLARGLWDRLSAEKSICETKPATK